MEELKFLEEQQVAPELIKRVEEFRSRYEAVSYTHLTLPTICSV